MSNLQHVTDTVHRGRGWIGAGLSKARRARRKERDATWAEQRIESYRRPSRSVRDVMSWPALAVTPRFAAAYALRLAAEGGFHHLPVLDAGKLVGLVCTCDLLEAPPLATIAAVMSSPAITVRSTASLANALVLMEDNDVDCLPTHWLGAWGVVTRGDLCRAGACDDSDRPQCLACGSAHHVRRDPRDENQYVCIDCLHGDADRHVAIGYRDDGGAPMGAHP
jgi:CBS domain-containing protein